MTDTKNNPISFARPPFAKEVLTEDAKKRYDELEGWQRHLIKRLIEHGDLSRAAQESGVGQHVSTKVDLKALKEISIADALEKVGVTPTEIATHIRECIEADCARFDKHGQLQRYRDLNLTLKALTLACQLRGDFDKNKGPPQKKPDTEVELFRDTDLKEYERKDSGD